MGWVMAGFTAYSRWWSPGVSSKPSKYRHLQKKGSELKMQNVKIVARNRSSRAPSLYYIICIVSFMYILTIFD